MLEPRRTPRIGIARSDWTSLGVLPLPATADATHGSSNLATVPRAGNISSDMRAGKPW
jgi:hypothetical protein